MKCLLYPEFDRVEMAEAPLPRAGAGEVLLKVASCGICGSELEGFRKRSPRRVPPLIMGHEFCGVVQALGEGVTNVAIGQKVVSNSLVPCGSCVRCRRGDTHLCAQRQIFGMHRAGAFAEFVNVPARVLIPWPDDLPAEAACLAEPLGNGVHIVNLTRHLTPKTVLVIGGGPIGLMTQQAYQAMLGATVFVSDLVPERLEAAHGLGAKRVINPATEDVVKIARELTDGEGVDIVVDAVGGKITKQQSLAAARPGGAAVWIGLHENDVVVDTYEITLPERTIFGTYAATQAELQTAVDLMVNGAVDARTWTTPLALDRGVEAFQRALAAKGSDIKMVLVP